jgi:hypothetical protein
MVTLPSGETPPLTQVDGGVFFLARTRALGKDKKAKGGSVSKRDTTTW